MGLNIQSFVGAVVGIIVAVVVTVVIAIPVISSNEVPDTVTNYASINSMLGIIPLLNMIGLGCVLVVASLLFTKWANCGWSHHGSCRIIPGREEGMIGLAPIQGL